MTKRVTRHLFFITAIAACLTQCKKGEVIPSTSNLITFNLTEADQKVTGARIYIFDNPTNLELSKGKLSAVNAIDSAVSADGVASVELNTEIPHWLFIVYRNEDKQLTFTNEGYDNVINTLPKNLDVSVDIKLLAVDGNFAFWTSDSTALPITLSFGTETYTLTKARSAAPLTANDENIVLVRRLSGAYSYYAKNEDKNCVWNEALRINKGEFQPNEIVRCGTNEITMWSDDKNTAHFPITVVLNNTDTLGVIDKSVIGYTCGGDKSNVLSAYRDKGKFTYFAYSADGACAWTGSFDNSQCTSIQLKECK